MSDATAILTTVAITLAILVLCVASFWLGRLWEMTKADQR